MGYEVGGYAGKLGDRYEGRWVVLQMLYVLAGRLRTITLESVGDDEKGVDLWVETNDDLREAQQCKGEHGTKSQWSMADLDAKGILDNLRFQLERNDRHRFALVSSVQARSLLDLTRRARDSTGTVQDFYELQVKPTKEHNKEFLAFCRYLGLKASSPSDLDCAYQLLRRSDFHPFAGDRKDEQVLEMWAWHLVDGKPSVVISVLADFAGANLRKTLTSDTLIQYLRAQGFGLRDLARDDRVATRISELRQMFADTFGGQLAGGRLISRLQAAEVLKQLNSSLSGKIIILHGRAGYGKSGVLLELTKLLEQQGFPYLPLRLDRQIPRGSAQHFGETLGLRESPAMCISQLVGENSAVLILDQIDAMRWTSAHASESWLTCQEVIRQATRLGNVRVVVACRTFDLDNDPQFAAWAKETELAKVEVGDLEDTAIRICIGDDFEALNGRQRILLKSVQNLAMWLELRLASATPTGFVSATDLMRKFWDNRYRELNRRGVSSDDVKQILDMLIDRFNEHGTLSCPYREVQPFKQTVDELQSLNVIGVAGSSVTFCHQSYADYLLALRLAKEISAGNKTIFDWLGSKTKQSLFRREQLRLLLTLMRDENPSWYIATVESLLKSLEIRFHLKHLCLQVVGQVQTPNESEITLVMNLLEQGEWKEHLTTQVFWRNPPWMQQDAVKHKLREWLSGTEEGLIGHSLWLLRCVDTMCGDLVAEMIEPYDGVDETWDERLEWMFVRSPNDDSDRLFALRLRRVERNRTFEYVDWEKLAKATPHRCLPLIAARLRGFLHGLEHEEEDKTSTQRSQRRSSIFEITKKEEMDALEQLAVANAQYVWDEIIPLVERVLTFDRGKIRGKLSKLAYVTRRRRRFGYRFLRPLCRILAASGQVLLEQDFAEYSTRLDRLSAIRAKPAQQIVLDTILSGNDEIADWAVQWLLEKPSRLQLGRRGTPGRFIPARRLIKRFAAHCSDEVYRRLEQALIGFHPKEEWQSSRFRHHEIEAGMCRDYGRPNLYGMAHFFLLAALPKHRMSQAAIRESGVAKRKFGHLYPGYFDRLPRGCGGTIVSPIPSARLHLVNDQDWLKISSEYTTDREGAAWRQLDEDHAAECSAETFSRDLQAIAQRQPRRFARLAIRIPKDTNPSYLTAIMRAFEAKSSPDGATDEEAANWEPVPAAEIEAVFQHAQTLGHTGLEHSFCTAVREQPEAGWSESALGEICRLAMSHLDPAAEELIITKKWDERTVNDLETTALNHVRGPAALAIHSLLFHDPGLLPRLRSAIDALISDVHPGVRVAAAAICLPVWNIDRALAVRLFLNLCESDDDRILPSHYASHFVNYAQTEYLEYLVPLIERMVNSAVDEVQEHGASRTTFIWLCTQHLGNLFKRCLNGSASLKKGVATIAADNARHANRGDTSRELLRKLLDDSEQSVRQAARAVFRRVDVFECAEMEPLVSAYLSTAAFKDDPTELLDALDNYKGSLVTYRHVLFAICDTLAGDLAADSRSMASRIGFEADKIPPLLLRLYEQAQGKGLPEVQDRCLDTWDELLEQRVGAVRGLVERLDV